VEGQQAQRPEWIAGSHVVGGQEETQTQDRVSIKAD